MEVQVGVRRERMPQMRGRRACKRELSAGSIMMYCQNQVPNMLPFGWRVHPDQVMRRPCTSHHSLAGLLVSEQLVD